jgi:hypothetical protein
MAYRQLKRRLAAAGNQQTYIIWCTAVPACPGYACPLRKPHAALRNVTSVRGRLQELISHQNWGKTPMQLKHRTIQDMLAVLGTLHQANSATDCTTASSRGKQSS